MPRNISDGQPPVSSNDHASINHAGITGVPAAEAFTSGAHAVVDHSAIPGAFQYQLNYGINGFQVAPFFALGAAGLPDQVIAAGGRVTRIGVNNLSAAPPDNISVYVNGVLSSAVYNSAPAGRSSFVFPSPVVVSPGDSVSVEVASAGSVQGEYGLFIEP